MKLTDIFKFKLFERTDPVDMETVNENFESVEKIFDGLTAEDVGAVATKGNTADNTVAFTTASERTKISSGETHATLFGKIAKWFADLKTVAFSGNYNDLSNKPTIPTVVNNNTTTEAGYALDARQANPNVDGSLAKQISTLNNGLTLKVINLGKGYNGINYVWYHQMGRVVCVTVGGTADKVYIAGVNYKLTDGAKFNIGNNWHSTVEFNTGISMKMFKPDNDEDIWFSFHSTIGEGTQIYAHFTYMV